MTPTTTTIFCCASKNYVRNVSPTRCSPAKEWKSRSGREPEAANSRTTSQPDPPPAPPHGVRDARLPHSHAVEPCPPPRDRSRSAFGWSWHMQMCSTIAVIVDTFPWPQPEQRSYVAEDCISPVSYTHLRAHETPEHLV